MDLARQLKQGIVQEIYFSDKDKQKVPAQKAMLEWS